MKKKVIIIVMGILLLGVFFQPVFSMDDNQIEKNKSTRGIQVSNKEIEGELIVTLEDSGTDEGSDLLSRKHSREMTEEGFKIKDHFSPGKSGNAKGIQKKDTLKVNDNQREKSIYLIEHNAKNKNWEKVTENLQKALENQGFKVKSIEKNYEVEILSTNYIHRYQEWHYDMLNVSGAWEITQGEKDITIAVLDTGIDYRHESLKDLISMNLGVNFSSSGDENDFFDRHGHGTHVSGNIASYNKVSGVMKKATLMPIKVISDEGSGSHYSIIKGIYYAVDNGADVINMSIGGTSSNNSYEEAINFAASKNVIVVAAAGNDGTNSLRYPAKYGNTISVGSLDKDGTRSSFSNYGSGLDIMSPGRTIYSTTIGDNYGFYSGTSMATPQISGVVGLMKTLNPDITIEQVREILTSKTVSSNPSNSLEYGSGVIDAREALLATQKLEKPIDSADELYEYAISQIYLSNKFNAFVTGYKAYPDDTRFQEGLKKSAENLLNWSQRQHSNGNFNTAIVRYNRLKEEQAILPLSIINSVENSKKKALLKQEIDGVNVFIQKNSDLIYVSSIFRGYVDGYPYYQWNKNYIENTIISTENLLSWSRRQHNRGNFNTAILRYDLITNNTKNIEELNQIRNTSLNLRVFAEKRILPTAKEHYIFASNQRYLSSRFVAFSNGYYGYPKSVEIQEGFIRTSNSLLNWAQRQHSNGRYDVAIQRYNLLLKHQEILLPETKEAVINSLKMANQGKTLLGVSEQIKELDDLLFLSQIFNGYIENYNLYSWNEQYRLNAMDSANNLLNWSKRHHSRGNFNTAILRYNLIIEKCGDIENFNNLVEETIELREKAILKQLIY